ncbi:MAG: hypothetical protein AAF810_08735 [Cyanobacteria bacterium P01_D01_bin.36]
MNVRFRDPELERQFREYAESDGKTMNTVMNEITKEFFSIDISQSDDRLEKLRAAVLIVNALPWSELAELLSRVRENPLNRNASVADLCLGTFDEGMKVYRERYQGSAD